MRGVEEPHAASGQDGPAHVAEAARGEQREGDRAEQLQGAGQAQRQQEQRGIDQVHPGDGRPEAEHQERVRTAARQRWPVHEQQEHRGQAEAQGHGSRRADRAGEPLADGLPELDAEHACEHQRGGGELGHASRLDAAIMHVQRRFRDLTV
ncbi:hypothetical protein GCM10010376_16350 [Streptomyces violaceusniger]